MEFPKGAKADNVHDGEQQCEIMMKIIIMMERGRSLGTCTMVSNNVSCLFMAEVISTKRSPFARILF